LSLWENALSGASALLQLIFIAIVGTWFYNLFETTTLRKVSYCLLSIVAYIITFFILSTVAGISLIAIGYENALHDFDFAFTIAISVTTFGVFYWIRERILTKREMSNKPLKS
jgi:hypothetical protein